MKRISVVLFAWLLLASLSAQTVQLRGIVQDSLHHSPIQNALVSVNGTRYGMLTNAAGEFLLDVPQDSLRNKSLTVYAPTYRLKTVLLPADLGYTVVSLSAVPVARSSDWATSDNDGFTKAINRIATLIATDCIPLGNPQTNTLDFGRIQSSIRVNALEGLRLRGGLASTARFHPRLFLKGYVAYGFKDQKVKYRGEAVYALRPVTYHEQEFPKKNIGAVYEDDFWAFAEKNAREPNDDFLYAYVRSNQSMVYRRFWESHIDIETAYGLAYTAWLRKSDLTPAQDLTFVPTFAGASSKTLSKISVSEAGLRLRYTFGGEAYAQNRRMRKSTSLNNPVILATHTVGLGHFLNGTAPFFHRSELSLQQRFVLGTAGRLDAAIDVQKVWNSVPFPLLVYPNQRTRFLIASEAFYLSPSLEFIGDTQYAVRATFVGDKLLLSKMPLFRSLGFKELISFRLAKSWLSDKNIPNFSNQLLQLPPQTGIMGKAPYMEASIGIADILNVLRIEYIHRINYRNNPEAIKGAFRVDVTI